MADVLKGYPVSLEVPVAWGEMDAMGHVNNIVYFRYFESARIAYFEKMGLIDFMKKTGIGPILATTSCRFRIPLTYPDSVLIGAKVVSVEDDRLVMNYIVVSKRHRKPAAEGEGVIVAFDYRGGKKVPVPEALKQKVLEIERSGRAERPGRLNS